MTSEIVACRCLRSADTTTLQVPSTRRATLGDFPVAAARAWNSLPLDTRACSTLLTFRRETKSHLFRQSYSCTCICLFVFLVRFFMQGGQQCWALWAILAACPCTLFIDIIALFINWANKDACLLTWRRLLR